MYKLQLEVSGALCLQQVMPRQQITLRPSWYPQK